MKRVLPLTLIIIMIATLFCGCGASAPNTDLTEKNVEKTVDAAFAALKEFDVEALDTYVKSSTLSQIISFSEGHYQFSELGRAIFANLEYEITEIDLDAMTVTVAVTNKDLEQATKDFADELLSEYSLFDLLNLITDDAWLDENLSVLTKKIDECEMNPDSKEVLLKIREGSENLVLRFGTEAENAVSGGALGAINSLTSF